MKLENVLVLAAVGIGGYYIVKAIRGIADTGKKAVDTASTAIADAWLRLFPMPPAMELLGQVKFPGNLFVPLQQLANGKAIRQDSSGTVFVNYADHIWQLQPSNAAGNWPAVLVK